jgi:hypothetical protein
MCTVGEAVGNRMPWAYRNVDVRHLVATRLRVGDPYSSGLYLGECRMRVDWTYFV